MLTASMILQSRCETVHYTGEIVQSPSRSPSAYCVLRADETYLLLLLLLRTTSNGDIESLEHGQILQYTCATWCKLAISTYQNQKLQPDHPSAVLVPCGRNLVFLTPSPTLLPRFHMSGRLRQDKGSLFACGPLVRMSLCASTMPPLRSLRGRSTLAKGKLSRPLPLPAIVPP